MSTLAINGGTPVRTKPWPAWPQWGGAERQAIMDVLESGVWGGYADAVKNFEAAFAERHAAKHCIAVVNGTLTMVAALHVLGVGPGDEVIVPPYTFFATASAVRLLNATPVFVDIDLETYNLDPMKVEAAISPKTKAMIPVHFGGQPADMDALLPLAEKYNLGVVEDAAHAHGSTWHGSPVGTLGHIGSFSFQATKNLTAGEGGALLTNDDDLALQLWSYSNQGRSPEGAWYGHPNLGSNLRISAWQVAILLAQMEKFEEELERRMANARRLHEIFAEVEGITPIRWDERAESHAHHVYLTRYNAEAFKGVSRDKFHEALQAEGIVAATGYAVPLYKQPPLVEPYSRITPCPAAEEACKVTLSFRQRILLAEPEDIDDIGQAVFKIRENIEELLGD